MHIVCISEKWHFFGVGRKSPGRSPGGQKAPRAARSAAGGGAEQGRADKCQNQECPFAPYFKMALKLVIFRVPEDWNVPVRPRKCAADRWT